MTMWTPLVAAFIITHTAANSATADGHSLVRKIEQLSKPSTWGLVELGVLPHQDENTDLGGERTAANQTMAGRDAKFLSDHKGERLARHYQKDGTIPGTLLFNHKSRLLDELSQANGAHMNSFEKHLAENVKNTISLFPDIHEVEFLDNRGCRAAIQKAHSEELAAHFDKEPKGMYKSDICRLAQLALHGGYYMDTDYHALVDIRDRLPPQVSFASVIAIPWVSRSPNIPNEMFQSFIAAAPRHPVVLYALDKCLDFYAGRNKSLVKELGGFYVKKQPLQSGSGKKGHVAQSFLKTPQSSLVEKRVQFGRLQGTLLLRLAFEEWMGTAMKPGLLEKSSESKFKYSYFFEEESLNSAKYPHLKPQNGVGNNCNVMVLDRVSNTPVAFSHTEQKSCSQATVHDVRRQLNAQRARHPPKPPRHKPPKSVARHRPRKVR